MLCKAFGTLYKLSTPTNIGYNWQYVITNLDTSNYNDLYIHYRLSNTLWNTTVNGRLCFNSESDYKTINYFLDNDNLVSLTELYGSNNFTQIYGLLFPNINSTAYTISWYLEIIFSKKSSKDITGTPINVSAIGSQARLLFYGLHNAEYKGGIMLNKTTTATTGSITLGNAVGYIKVNFNGEIIKIPYYNE